MRAVSNPRFVPHDSWGGGPTNLVYAIGLIPNAGLLLVITFDIIGVVAWAREPLLPSSAVVPVAIMVFAWSAICVVVGLLIGLRASKIEEQDSRLMDATDSIAEPQADSVLDGLNRD